MEKNRIPRKVGFVFMVILFSFIGIGISYAPWTENLKISASMRTLEDFTYVYLCGHWRFDEGSGSMAQDSSGFCNDGTVYGASWTYGKIGNALYFDGINDQVVVPDSNSLDVSDQLTIMAWIKPHSVYTGGNWRYDDPILCKRYAYYFVMNADGKLAFYGYGLLPPGWVVGANMSGCVNTWVHVAVTYDGNYVKLYINGTLDTSVPKTGSIVINDKCVRMGYVDYNRHFHGIIDDVRIYNKALTADEIYQKYLEGFQG